MVFVRGIVFAFVAVLLSIGMLDDFKEVDGPESPVEQSRLA